jgi:YfiH family protein
MSIPAFLRSAVLDRLGIEHGFGTRRSEGIEVPGLALATQVHGSIMLRVPPVDPSAEADALWTREPGLAVGVRTADCVPVLLVDVSRRAVAAIHAGWRGSAARICELGAAELACSIDVDPAELIAVIGPHVGPCCYEVDRPVHEAIHEDAAFSPSVREGHHMLDLFALSRLQLLRAGLRPERILRAGGCTCCDSRLYASYRRDGSGQRMAHFVRMPAP